jgi:hypothetical protein
MLLLSSEFCLWGSFVLGEKGRGVIGELVLRGLKGGEGEEGVGGSMAGLAVGVGVGDGV